VLYAIFVEKFKESADQKQNFFEFVKKFLQEQPGPNGTTARSQISLEGGFKFALSLMKEIRLMAKKESSVLGTETSSEMLINSLEYLYQTLRQSEVGALHGHDKMSFIIDSNLNDARAFLLTILNEKDSAPARAVELAAKIILLIAIARSNAEDFLIVSQLLG